MDLSAVAMNLMQKFFFFTVQCVSVVPLCWGVWCPLGSLQIGSYENLRCEFADFGSFVISGRCVVFSISFLQSLQGVIKWMPEGRLGEESYLNGMSKRLKIIPQSFSNQVGWFLALCLGLCKVRWEMCQRQQQNASVCILQAVPFEENYREAMQLDGRASVSSSSPHLKSCGPLAWESIKMVHPPNFNLWATARCLLTNVANTILFRV